MNILVTGAAGQLGSELRAIVANHKQDNYLFCDIVGDFIHLDITDADALRSFVQDNNIDCIINCAAYTNVDKAEDDQETAKLINADAVANCAQVIKQRNGVLIHISTDYVFGGIPYNTPCKEDQTGLPTGVYGTTKLLGEQAIISSECNYLIIRTSWLYSQFGNNFVKTMMNLTATRDRLNVVFDQCGTPTYAADLAEVIFHIVSNRKFEGTSGIYHYSNEGVCSWYDFAKMIAQIAKHNNCLILPCHSDEFPSKVKRPAYSVLDKSKIKQTFDISIPYWVDSLSKLISILKENKD